MKRRNDEFVLFQTEDRKIALDVRFEEETVWLSLDQMADLFDRNKSTISRHIKNVFDEAELQREQVVADFATTEQAIAVKGTHENILFQQAMKGGV